MEPGELLSGRFRLGPHLEKSRRGEIFLAQDEADGHGCEVEVVRLSGFDGEEAARLAEREVEVGRRLAAVPGLLRARAMGLHDGWVFVARDVEEGACPIPLASGGLRRRVQHVSNAARLVAGLAAVGAVHRDLGPTTILVAPDGSARLAGLALVRLDGVPEPAPTPLGLAVSAVLCAPPELFEQPWRVDPRGDVWSLGALLFRGLAGAWPFPGPTLPQAVRQQERVRHGKIGQPRPAVLEPTLPVALDAACVGALALDPASRTATPTAFADALDAWLATAPPEPATEPTPAAGIVKLAWSLRTEAGDGRPQPRLVVGGAALRADDAVEDPLAPSGRFAPTDTPTPRVAATRPVQVPAPPGPPLPLPDLPGLPVDALPALRREGATTLVFSATARELDGAVRALRRLDPGSATRLLVDLRAVEHLGGAQLEALTELLTISERKGLRAGLFGLRPALRTLLSILARDVAHVLPPVIDQDDPAAAAAALDAVAAR